MMPDRGEFTDRRKKSSTFKHRHEEENWQSHKEGRRCQKEQNKSIREKMNGAHFIDPWIIAETEQARTDSPTSNNKAIATYKKYDITAGQDQRNVMLQQDRIKEI